MSRLRTLLIGKNPTRTLLRSIVLGALVYAVFSFWLFVGLTSGESMAPTYKDRRPYLGTRLGLDNLDRGDVVVVSTRSGGKLSYLKRIVGLPGESVAFTNGVLSINGAPLHEPYVVFECDWSLPPRTLQPSEFYVVGDNRSMPIETHWMGRISRDRVTARLY